jgi:HPt (histidine-containing phosphotransfer) domain-containing protein
MKPIKVVLDPERMRHFIEAEQGSGDLFATLAQTYLETSRKLLVELDKTADPSEAAQLSHQIRELSENIGARKMETIAQTITNLAQAGKMKDLQTLVAQAKKAFEETENSLSLLLEGRNAG